MHMKKKTLCQALLGLLGALLLTAGILQGDYRVVLNKAIRICYECIGIG